MNCKNCNEALLDTTKYCSNCGAKVVSNRITTKELWSSFATDFFGWDNKYLKTMRALFSKPEMVLDGYLQGIRKKYVTPFVFLAIGTALSMLLFNELADDYIQMSNAFNDRQMELIHKSLDNTTNVEDYKEGYRKSNTDLQNSVLKYFNFFTFLLVPVYAFFAFLVFGKPHNFAEHLIINCYLQGASFLIGTIFFLLSIFTNPLIYYIGIIVTMAYYLFAYSRLNGYSKGTAFLKLLKFLGILLIPLILSYPFGYLLFYLKTMLFG